MYCLCLTVGKKKKKKEYQLPKLLFTFEKACTKPTI